MSALSFKRKQPPSLLATTQNRFITFAMKTNKHRTNATLRIILFAPLAMTAFAQSADDQNALLQMEQGWNLALKNKDISWFEKNLAEDLTDTSSGSGALH